MCAYDYNDCHGLIFFFKIGQIIVQKQGNKTELSAFCASFATHFH